MSLWLFFSMLMPLALTLLSVALSAMPISLYVLLTHWGTWSLDLVLFFSADSASLTVAIQLVLYRDHSIVVNFISCLFLRPFFLYSTQRCTFRSSVYQFHSMPIHIIQKVHFIGVACIWIHRPFSSMFSSISPLSFPCSYWVAWHLSIYQPFHLL